MEPAVTGGNTWDRESGWDNTVWPQWSPPLPAGTPGVRNRTVELVVLAAMEPAVTGGNTAPGIRACDLY